MPYFSYCGGSWIHRRSYACVPRRSRVDLSNTPFRPQPLPGLSACEEGMKTRHCRIALVGGGCWYSIKPFLSASNRSGFFAPYHDGELGFRLVRRKG